MCGGFNAHFDGLTELFRRRASSLESMLGSSAAKASFCPSGFLTASNAPMCDVVALVQDEFIV